MSTNKSTFIKGGICGIFLSCLNNLLIIFSLYGNFDTSIYYETAIITAILTFLFFINVRILNVIYSFLVSIVAFLITEFVISSSGIVIMVFKHIHGASAEMWAGDGFGMVIILLFNLTGYILGSILALSFTAIKKFINYKRLCRNKT